MLDRSLHGKGLGSILLADALERIIATGEAGPAVRAVVADASTDQGRSLYSRFSFVPSPRLADRMIVRAETIA
jgi:GNAT superfamily N-acetyltransferase